MTGAVELLPETPQDVGFVRRLFDAQRAPRLAMTGLAPPALEILLAMQLRGQAISYRASWPGARYWVAWRAGTPVGRLVEADAEAGLWVVDIAVAPEHRRQGLARAMLAPLIDRACAAGFSIGAHVDWDNYPSRAMFEQLGFAPCGDADALQSRLVFSGRDIA